MSFYVRNPATAYVSHEELSLGADYPDVFYIAHLEHSTISAVDGAGILIWNLLQTPKTEQELVTEVASVFEESEETVRAGTLAFIRSLSEQELVLTQENAER